MYRTYFGIEDSPFSNTPDPRYLFMSTRHQEALAHLMYGIMEGSGFVLLSGDVGTGKTTISRCLIDQIPENIDLALCVNPRLNEVELLANICDEMGISTGSSPPSIKTLMDALNRHLLEVHARGRKAVLIIDEAQNLSPRVLEQVRLLTNLETAKSKLLQIILIAQPELNLLLERPEMRQLNQRISARYHLQPLSRAETRKYIHHRLRIGGLSPATFRGDAINRIYRHSNGVPRWINSISERCLMGAYSEGKKVIDGKLADAAAMEVLSGNLSKPAAKWPGFALAAVLAVTVIAIFLFISARPLDDNVLSGPKEITKNVD